MLEPQAGLDEVAAAEIIPATPLRPVPGERGELPPGLQKRLTAVPSPLAARLPRVPGSYDRYFAGDDLLVVDRRSNRIVSIIPDVF